MESLKEQFRTLVAQVQGWFSRLTERERRLVTAAGGAATVFILFLLLFSFVNSAAATRRRTAAKLLKLQQVQVLAANYNEVQRAREEAEASLRAANVSLLSYIEDKGTKAGLEVPTMSPKGDVPLGDDGRIIESSVDLTLTDIKMEKLVLFLNAVEQGPGVVKVRSLRLEPRPKDEVLTAWATVSTYHLKEGGP